MRVWPIYLIQLKCGWPLLFIHQYAVEAPIYACLASQGFIQDRT